MDIFLIKISLFYFWDLVTSFKSTAWFHIQKSLQLLLHCQSEDIKLTDQSCWYSNHFFVCELMTNNELDILKMACNKYGYIILTLLMSWYCPKECITFNQWYELPVIIK